MSTDPMPCGTCGQPHARCTSHKRDGAPCGQPRMTGQTVCKMHGGKAPQARAAAARRMEEQAAMAAVRTLGLPMDVSPTEALLEEVRWTAGHVAWLRERVQELDTQRDAIAYDPDGDGEAELMSLHPNHARHGLVWGTTSIKDKRTDDGGETTTVQGAGASLWYELYARERDHLVKVCAAAIRAGVEERKVRLAEQQGDLVALVIRRILDDLHLTPQQIELVPVVVPQHLRAIAMEGAH